MLAKFSRVLLNLAGWKVIYDIPAGQRQFVLIMAPHTSYWDFVIGRLALWSIGVKSYFLIKKEAFFFPLGLFLKFMGGFPVDRAHSNNVVHEVAQMFKQHPDMIISITPEGTRSLRKDWKKGFWYIARHSGVPVVMGYIDYGTKVAGVYETFWPGKIIKEDMVKIYDFYSNITALHPEKFSLSPVNRKSG